jgi:hypothetical protein
VSGILQNTILLHADPRVEVDDLTFSLMKEIVIRGRTAKTTPYEPFGVLIVQIASDQSLRPSTRFFLRVLVALVLALLRLFFGLFLRL